MKPLRTTALALVILAFASGCSSSSTPAPPPAVGLNNLYATQCTGTHMIDVFKPPFSNTSTPAVSVPFPTGTPCVVSGAYLPKTNQVAVGTNGSGWYVYSLPLTSTSMPVAHVAAPAFAGGFAQDSTGNVWVSDRGNDTINSFVPPITSTSTASVSFADTLGGPYVLQINGAGQMFAGNCDSKTVTMYTPPFTNTTTATATITPPSAICTEPIGLDATGNLYVSEFDVTANVWIYNPPYSNASTPATTITGGPSGTNSPTQFAFDPAGNIYIGNSGTGMIASFAPPLAAASPLRFSIPEPSVAGLFFGP
jgi:hypothetical protein